MKLQFNPVYLVICLSFITLIGVLISSHLKKMYENKLYNFQTDLNKITVTQHELGKRISKYKNSEDIFLYLTEIFLIMGLAIIILNLISPVDVQNQVNRNYQIVQRFFLLYPAYEVLVVVTLNIIISNEKEGYIALKSLADLVLLYLDTDSKETFKTIKNEIEIDLANESNRNNDLRDYCQFLESELFNKKEKIFTQEKKI